jgi:hypothetical protein
MRQGIIIAVVVAAALTGCAPVYKERPMWGMPGYSAKDISANTVSINYMVSTANTEAAKTYALYRCAELTAERGFDWFRVKEASGGGMIMPYSSSASFTYVIEMFKGPLPPTEQHIRTGRIYIAKDVMAQLDPQIVREFGTPGSLLGGPRQASWEAKPAVQPTGPAPQPQPAAAPQETVAQRPAAASRTEQRLIELKELYDRQMITQEEYDRKRQDILKTF